MQPDVRPAAFRPNGLRYGQHPSHRVASSNLSPRAVVENHFSQSAVIGGHRPGFLNLTSSRFSTGQAPRGVASAKVSTQNAVVSRSPSPLKYGHSPPKVGGFVTSLNTCSSNIGGAGYAPVPHRHGLRLAACAIPSPPSAQRPSSSARYTQGTKGLNRSYTDQQPAQVYTNRGNFDAFSTSQQPVYGVASGYQYVKDHGLDRYSDNQYGQHIPVSNNNRFLPHLSNFSNPSQSLLRHQTSVKDEHHDRYEPQLPLHPQPHLHQQLVTLEESPPPAQTVEHRQVAPSVTHPGVATHVQTIRGGSKDVVVHATITLMPPPLPQKQVHQQKDKEVVVLPSLPLTPIKPREQQPNKNTAIKEVEQEDDKTKNNSLHREMDVEPHGLTRNKATRIIQNWWSRLKSGLAGWRRTHKIIGREIARKRGYRNLPLMTERAKMKILENLHYAVSKFEEYDRGKIQEEAAAEFSRLKPAFDMQMACTRPLVNTEEPNKRQIIIDSECSSRDRLKDSFMQQKTALQATRYQIYCLETAEIHTRRRITSEQNVNFSALYSMYFETTRHAILDYFFDTEATLRRLEESKEKDDFCFNLVPNMYWQAQQVLWWQGLEEQKRELHVIQDAIQQQSMQVEHRRSRELAAAAEAQRIFGHYEWLKSEFLKQEQSERRAVDAEEHVSRIKNLEDESAEVTKNLQQKEKDVESLSRELADLNEKLNTATSRKNEEEDAMVTMSPLEYETRENKITELENLLKTQREANESLRAQMQVLQEDCLQKDHSIRQIRSLQQSAVMPDFNNEHILAESDHYAADANQELVLSLQKEIDDAALKWEDEKREKNETIYTLQQQINALQKQIAYPSMQNQDPAIFFSTDEPLSGSVSLFSNPGKRGSVSRSLKGSRRMSVPKAVPSKEAVSTTTAAEIIKDDDDETAGPLQNPVKNSGTFSPIVFPSKQRNRESFKKIVNTPKSSALSSENQTQRLTATTVTENSQDHRSILEAFLQEDPTSTEETQTGLSSSPHKSSDMAPVDAQVKSLSNSRRRTNSRASGQQGLMKTQVLPQASARGKFTAAVPVMSAETAINSQSQVSKPNANPSSVPLQEREALPDEMDSPERAFTFIPHDIPSCEVNDLGGAARPKITTLQERNATLRVELVDAQLQLLIFAAPDLGLMRTGHGSRAQTDSYISASLLTPVGEGVTAADGLPIEYAPISSHRSDLLLEQNRALMAELMRRLRLLRAMGAPPPPWRPQSFLTQAAEALLAEDAHNYSHKLAHHHYGLNYQFASSRRKPPPQRSYSSTAVNVEDAKGRKSSSRVRVKGSFIIKQPSPPPGPSPAPDQRRLQTNSSPLWRPLVPHRVELSNQPFVTLRQSSPMPVPLPDRRTGAPQTARIIQSNKMGFLWNMSPARVIPSKHENGEEKVDVFGLAPISEAQGAIRSEGTCNDTHTREHRCGSARTTPKRYPTPQHPHRPIASASSDASPPVMAAPTDTLEQLQCPRCPNNNSQDGECSYGGDEGLLMFSSPQTCMENFDLSSARKVSTFLPQRSRRFFRTSSQNEDRKEAAFSLIGRVRANAATPSIPASVHDDNCITIQITSKVECPHLSANPAQAGFENVSSYNVCGSKPRIEKFKQRCYTRRRPQIIANIPECEE